MENNQNIDNHLVQRKRRKFLLFMLAAILYTIIVVIISVNITKYSISKRIENSYKSAFSDTSNGTNKNSISNNTKTDSKKDNNKPVQLKLNEQFTVGNVAEITLENSEWNDMVLPSNTNGSYSYMNNEEGEKYFIIRGKIKNIASESFDIQYMNESTLIVNDTYKFPVTITAEENDGTGLNGQTKPLQTLSLVIYASVSDEVCNNAKNVTLDMNVLNDNTHVKNFYDEDMPHSNYTITFNE